MQRYLKRFNKSKLRNTERLSKEIMTLPMYPSLKLKEIKKVLFIIEKWSRKIK
jgi:dTDP-4-amino-4,6-dideoxygalactose transaminase